MERPKLPRLYLDDEERERQARLYMRVDSSRLARDTMHIALALMAAVAVMAIVLMGVMLLIGMLLRAGNTPVASAITVIAAGAGVLLVGYLLGRYGWGWER